MSDSPLPSARSKSVAGLVVTGQIALWLVFAVTFGLELARFVLADRSASESAHVRIVKAGYWSSLLVMELIMAGLVVYFMIKRPGNRLRLACLSVCHFSTILVLPMVMRDWSWAAVLYPWPHTLLAFDAATPRLVFWISMAVGFVAIPLMTLRWGRNGFCGYVCPHGAFYTETYARCYRPHMGRLRALGRVIPPLYFGLMLAALAAILLCPSSAGVIRSIQKVTFFATAEFFYFVIAVPLIGGRSYCELICPLGYAIRGIERLRGGRKGRDNSGHDRTRQAHSCSSVPRVTPS